MAAFGVRRRAPAWLDAGDDLVTADDRLLKILRSLNEIGPCSVLDLSRATGISRPAVYRIVETLCRDNYAERIPDASRVRLTSEVLALSSGYRAYDWVAEAAVPILARLQREVRWPSSLATPDKDQMIIRETTRYRSPFVFDAGRVGLRLPMLATSLGLAYLAFCARGTRSITLDLLRKSPRRWDAVARNRERTERLLRNTAQRGYAFRDAGFVRETCSVAVPIQGQDDALGSICVTYVNSALTQREAATQFLPPLKAAAAEIAARATG